MSEQTQLLGLVRACEVFTTEIPAAITRKMQNLQREKQIYLLKNGKNKTHFLLIIKCRRTHHVDYDEGIVSHTHKHAIPETMDDA